MFFDPLEDKILDFVGGQKDLEAKLIRFIGDPHERILEDHLRVLRAIRFKNQFNFQYEPKTYTALHKHSRLVIDKVSFERIGDEINKMMMSAGNIHAFEDMEDVGVLEVILPEIQALKGVGQPFEYHLEGDVWNHTMMALASLAPTATLGVRWATLLHDSGKPETFQLKERIRFDHHVQKSRDIARDILTRLRYPRRLVDEVCWIVLHHMMLVPLVEMPEGRKRKWFLDERFLDLMQVCKADAEGTIPGDLDLYNKIMESYRGYTSKLKSPPKPLITGEEVMKQLNIKPSKKVGELLEQIREHQLAGDLKTKKQAIAMLKKL